MYYTAFRRNLGFLMHSRFKIILFIIPVFILLNCVDVGPGSILQKSSPPPFCEFYSDVKIPLGKGTEEIPYHICNVDQFLLVGRGRIASGKAFNLNDHYILLRNLDMDGREIDPIGVGEQCFTGVFDLNGYKLMNYILNATGIEPDRMGDGRDIFACPLVATVTNQNLSRGFISLFGGKDCTNDVCEYYIKTNFQVAFIVNIKEGGFRFKDWKAIDNDCGPRKGAFCGLTLKRNRLLDVDIEPIPTNGNNYTLTIMAPTNGRILITALPGGNKYCTPDGKNCTQTLREETQVALIAVPDEGYRYKIDSWPNEEIIMIPGDSCTFTNEDLGVCAMTLGRDKTVFALFEPIPSN